MSGLIDRAKLEEAFGPETAAEILDLFLNNVTETMEKLHKAVEAGDNSRAAAIAHEICGTASAVGSDHLSSCAKQLELMLAEGPDPRAPEVLARLQDLFEQVRAILSESSTH